MICGEWPPQADVKICRFAIVVGGAGEFRNPVLADRTPDANAVAESCAPVPVLTGTGDGQSDHCGSGSGVFPGLSPPPLPSRQGSPMPQHLPL